MIRANINGGVYNFRVAGVFIQLVTNAEVRRYLGGVRPVEDSLNSLHHAIQATNEYPFTVRQKNTDEFVGLVTISPHHNPVDMELSYMFLPRFWGKGYATETVKALLGYCERELGLNRVVSETQTANLRSRRLLEKLGYKLENQIERFDAKQSIYVYDFVSDNAYTYHPLHMSDYDEIYTLWENIPGVDLSQADNRENIETYLSRNPEQSFVCKVDNKIVGTILCGNDGRRAYIHHTAVAPEYRRHGIAAELVRLAMESQHECGMKKCHLFIFNENELGKEFWRSMGFDERKDIGVMSKNL